MSTTVAAPGCSEGGEWPEPGGGRKTPVPGNGS